MQTKKLTKFIFIIIAILFISLLLTGGSVQAALQANPSTHYKKADSQANWITNIRKMEAAGGAMGLTETLGTNLISTTSNNIDVHFIRSTEYGAMAILSASGYGNPNKIPTNGAGSTTGNNTGVLVNTNCYEHTSAGYGAFSGVDTRYYDLYQKGIYSSAKAGDALGQANSPNPGCNGWHGASTNVNATSSVMRGYGGVFSIYTGTMSAGGYAHIAVVCGEGF